MKKSIKCIIPALAVLLTINGLQAQTDLESARTSVVKITTEYNARNTATGRMEERIGTATGFCWNAPLNVVTALHAVAGVDKITVHHNNGSKTTARISKVLLEADLALLQLNSDLGLKPLTLASVNPNLGRTFTIWGFPHAVFKIQDNEVRLSRSLDAMPTLDDLITGDKLKYELEKQKYPSPKAKILKIGSIIQPGQSGAPLFTSDGKVVGVADGGLRGGTALLNWAMPASTYVPLLTASSDPIPRSLSIQASLFSASSTPIGDHNKDNITEDYSTFLYQAEKENTIVLANKSITKTWTASFAEIISTMSDEERSEIMTTVREYGVNMDDTFYDIYEDFDTGATISVPYGETFSIENGWYYTCNVDQSICYYVLSFNAGTYLNATSQAISIFDGIANGGGWNPYEDEDVPDEMEENDDDQEALYMFTRFAENDWDGRVLEFTTDIIGSNMLIAFLVYDDNKMDNPQYRKQFLHFDLALELRDFVNF